MADSRPPLAAELVALLDSRREGQAMPRGFYQSAALYDAELAGIWRGGWLFAGFAFELPNAGDFLTLAVDATSVLVIRGDDGAVRAFHNVCRHRGSQLCRTDTGHLRAIVCPYHSWTYSRRGELVACHGMHEGVDKSALGLKPVRAEVVAGLIYISLADAPPALDGMRKRFESLARRRASTARASPRPRSTRSRRTGSSSGRTIASATTARRAIRST